MDLPGFTAGKDTVAIVQGTVDAVPVNIMEPEMLAIPASIDGKFFVWGHRHHPIYNIALIRAIVDMSMEIS